MAHFDIRSSVAALLCFGVVTTAFYSAGFGQPSPEYYRGLMMLAAAAIIFLQTPLADVTDTPWLRAVLAGVDLILFGILCVGVSQFISVAGDITSGILMLSKVQVWSGLASILILLELTRRVFGPPIVILSLLALLYIVFGRSMPGILYHRGFGVERMMETLWYSFSGIFGMPSAVILDFVLIFVVFGGILQGTGASDRLLKIVFALTSGTRGGPALAAVFASGLFGTISGSVTANVVGTGTFTIPMIKRRGFSNSFAGAVEAVASAGGQIVPPVMGAAAFLMAELTGHSYLEVALAAVTPAFFYYASICIAVVVEARKLGIEPTPPSERQRLMTSDWLHSIQFVGPIATIIVVLVMGHSAAAAGFYAIIASLLLSLINDDFRRNPRRIVPAITESGRAGAALIVSAGALGVIIGTMDITGLGISFANLVLAVSESNLFLALVMTMLACILLGMGMPTLPAYLVIVLVMGPAIASFDIPILAVHFFVLYFGVLAHVTPPVAIAAFAAAPIAGANPLTIGVQAVRLAIIGFIVPFVYVLEPQLLLTLSDFDATGFIWVAVRLALAIMLLTTALSFYDFRRLSSIEVAVRTVVGMSILFGHTISIYVEMVAIVLGLLLLAGERWRARQAAAPAGVVGESEH